jgi:hypothetical protein
MTANPPTCQKCGSPVTPGMKFCESCGAKIEALPACPKCGAALAPDVKFCETCGAPVSTATAPAVPAATTPVAPTVPEAQAHSELPKNVAENTVPVSGEKAVSQKQPAKTKKKAVSAPQGKPVPPEPPVKAEENAVPVPEEKLVPSEPLIRTEEKILPATGGKTAPVPVKEPPKTGKPVDVPKETGPKKPIPQKTLIIAGIVVLALLGAAFYFVVLPMLSGSGTPSGNLQVLPVTTGLGSSSGTPATTADTSLAGSVSLTPGPTQNPPSNRIVIVDAERDPISSLITVTFKGGAGQYGVKEIVVTLTRSDGSQDIKTFKPNAIGDGVTLQGTAKTDRIEATTHFYSGESYKILDQIFEYKKRGG